MLPVSVRVHYVDVAVPPPEAERGCFGGRCREQDRPPSGDLWGSPWLPDFGVRFCRSLPSAFMTKTSAPVSWPQLVQAILCPSGDQAGSQSATAFRVSGRSPPPSALITQSSRHPRAHEGHDRRDGRDGSVVCQVASSPAIRSSSRSGTSP